MRVLSSVDVLEVPPGGSGELAIDVVNTSDVIEGVTARVLGLPAEHTRTQPAVLPLFPDASGRLVVHVELPSSFPAGTHPVTVEVIGQAPGARVAHHDVDVVVGTHAELGLAANPSVVRARRKATFEVQVRNRGNVPLDVALRASDSDRSLQCAITPSTVTVAPGAVTRCKVQVRGPRHLVGGDRDRPLRVEGSALDQQETVSLVLRQRAVISKGLLTVLVLLAIVAAWAAIFLFGIREVLGSDPLTKVAPGSFFAATAEDDDGTGADGAVPVGAVAKDGVLGSGVGGTLTGRVVGHVDGEGVGRITVEALRRSRDGLVVVGSAATQSDGTYAVGGLFPGSYLLRFSADGYDTVWYPGADSEAGARPVRAEAQSATEGLDVAIVGHAAAIRGTVDVGDVTQPTETTVVARAAWTDDEDPITFETVAGPDGTFELTDLPAPGTYEITFTAEGYEPVTITERVAGGQERFTPRVRLGAGTGQIRGTVTDGRSPLGGVEVSTTMDGADIVVGTPTVGALGTFVIPGLKTPGTYVVTFAKEGYATRTIVVDLTAGESIQDITVVLDGGAGTISGRVVDPGGTGLGGVTVTVGGATTAMSATTLTAGEVGAFTLAGLGPGLYTVTFTLDGYQSQSVPVDLTQGQAAPLRVTLRPALGRIEGRVTLSGDGVAGVEVQATDGHRLWATTSTSGGGRPAGHYAFTDLPPGTYTVTVTQAGRVVESAVVTVRAGRTATQDLRLPAVT